VLAGASCCASCATVASPTRIGGFVFKPNAFVDMRQLWVRRAADGY
jgi:hypothetical protein